MHHKKIKTSIRDMVGIAPFEGSTELMGVRNIRASLSPHHSEIEALIRVMKCMRNLQRFQVTFVMDCSRLVKMVSDPKEWPAFSS